MEREVILGPWRRAWEHGGGRWADKNQTWPRQEHAEDHMHRLLCTYTVHITQHTLKYAKNTQMRLLAVACKFSFVVFPEATKWKKFIHLQLSEMLSHHKLPLLNTTWCFPHFWHTISCC